MSAARTDTTVEQTVGDEAQVTGMIGVVHGDVRFYTLDGGSPADTYRVGRNYLDGTMPREAERLIREAFMSGYRSTEVSYYWSLAILSDRSFDHLSEENFTHLEHAFAAIRENEPDLWLHALDVVAQLVGSLIAQEQQIEPDPDAFDAALAAYGLLPAERRDEVRRHLEMVLAGGIQDQLEARDAAEIRQRRMGGDRERRAWKFFEPKPEPARKLAPPDQEPDVANLAKLVGGAALAVLCAVVGGRYLLGGSPYLFAAALLLYVGGAVLLLRYGLEQRLLTARARWAEARLNGWTPAGAVEVFSRSGPTAGFAARMGRLVAYRFDEHRPTDGRDVSAWRQESAGIRATLTREMVAQYAPVQPLPRVDALDWLARWHADSTFAAWETGELVDLRRRFAVPRRTSVLSAAGVALLVGSVALTAVNAAAVGPFLGPVTAAAWCAATVLMALGGAALRARSAVASAHAEESQRRLMAENKAFAQWQEELADRPTDAEMATWLDYDTAYVKAAAMRHFNLANRDLMAHVILTGKSRRSYGARVPFGPPRYSDYVIQVFLLAENGVRQFSVLLNMVSGAVASEQRRVFPYAAVTSTEARELCVRIDGEHREDVDVEEVRHRRNQNDKLVFSQRFTLTLDNMQAIEVLVGNVDEGLLDRVREDPRHLLELTRDTSGVNSAIRVLENIAADRGDWIQKERERRRRRILDYQRKRNTVLELEGGPTMPTPRPEPVRPEPARALPGPHRPFRELPQ